MKTLKDARRYALDLICDGKTQYHMLDSYEKAKLTGLIIDSTEMIHIWEYITEADFKNEVPVMLSDWLVSGKKKLGQDLLETIKNNAILYASKEAIRILEEQEKEWEYEKQFNKD